MGISDKIREFKESREEKADQEKMHREIEASAERIQREKELRQKEKAGKVSVELAKKRREEIARDFESNKVPLKQKIAETASRGVQETFLPRKQPQFSESTTRGRKILSGELREASKTRPHGKQHGPFNVIGVGTPRKMKYVTDGHGRSGQRATLEWRRENRQYQSEERKAKSETNRNWINSILGQEPEPVRQRKVHTKGGKRISQLDRFVDSL